MFSFFSLNHYLPHAVCYAEDPSLIATHVGADAVIALSYFSIPLAILYFIKERPEIEFRWIANLFILFIFWCGVTHVTSLVTTWYPIYGIQATVKLMTALASVLTAIMIWYIMPKALALPSPADLREANAALESEILVRREADRSLRQARDELERRVEERTAELEIVNQQLRQQTRFLESIIGNAGSPIWVKGVDNRYLIVNGEWEKVSALSRHDVVGRTDHDVFPASKADFFLRKDREVMMKGEPASFEEAVDAPTGQRTVLTTKFPILSEVGEVIAVGGMAMDVTPIKQAHADLVQLNRQLVEEMAMRERAQQEQAEYARQLEISNTELDAFAHTASHDLKEPLRGISHYATFAMEDHPDDLPDDVRSRLIDIRKMATRLQGMIDSLYRLAKSGRHWNPASRIRLAECAGLAVETLGSYLNSRSAVVEVDATMPACRVDPDQIQQLYLNLISNGVKYNNSPDKRLSVGWYRSVSDLPVPHRPGALKPDIGPVFFVSDNGIGIPEEAWLDVFTVFRRLDRNADSSDSHGVGLSIAKRIVERHGGLIWTSARQGGGSVFYFTLDQDQ